MLFDKTMIITLLALLAISWRSGFIVQATNRSKLPKFAYTIHAKKHFFVNEKKSMIMNFEIKYEKIGFMIQSNLP